MPPLPDSPQHLAPDAPPPRWRRRWPAATLVVVLLAAVVVAGVTLADRGTDADLAAVAPSPSSTAPPTTTTSTSATSTTTTTAPPTPVTTVAPPTTAPAPPVTAAVPAPAAPVAGGALCIGDSVMLGASPPYLNTLSMCATIDAELSRQFSSAPATVAAHAPYPAAVVVHLGNNGTVDRDDVDAVMAELAGVSRVVFVTVQLNGTRSWEAQANREIRATAQRYPNVAIADWKAASDGHPDYTRADGIHMSAAGGGVYAATIAGAL